MRPMVRCFLKDETGATAIEYGLIVAVLSLAIVAGVGTAANSLQYMWGDNNSRLQQVINR
jgi:pilus assembly protein Flp/PilA